MDKITEKLFVSVDLDKLKDGGKGLHLTVRDDGCVNEERYVLTHLDLSDMAKLSTTIFEIANKLNE